MSRRQSGPTPRELLALRGNAAVRSMSQRFPPAENVLEQGRRVPRKRKPKKRRRKKKDEGEE